MRKATLRANRTVLVSIGWQVQDGQGCLTAPERHAIEVLARRRRLDRPLLPQESEVDRFGYAERKVAVRWQRFDSGEYHGLILCS